MDLACAICIQIKKGPPRNAVTIKGGTAVCSQHWGDARDENVDKAFGRLRVYGGVVEYEEEKDQLDEILDGDS